MSTSGHLGDTEAPSAVALIQVPGDGASVLVVDDEPGVREVIARWVQSSGYSAVSVANAGDALEMMSTGPAAVALCDIRMPGHDGLWLAGQLKQRFPETAVIMATGVQDVEFAVTSLRQGVLDYLVKPFGRDRLRDALRRAFDWHRTAVEARRWREALESEARVRSRRLAEALGALNIQSVEALDGVLSLLTIRGRDAYDHARRVGALAVKIASELGLQAPEAVGVERAALLHDVGKVAMPEAILRKPAPLSAEELAVVRTHPEIGYELLRRLPFLADAAQVVRTVHEWYGGSGYPNGLQRDAIPFAARIIAVADAYDTMTQPRVFRDPLPSSEALLEILRCSGIQFDPLVVAAFRRVLARDEAS